LRSLGAQVHGYALAPDRGDGLFNVTGVAADIVHRVGDVRDRPALCAAMDEAKPQVVIHMAAQALVRQSYVDPVTTFETNVIGTVNLLEAVRRCRSVEAVVVVTSDKCYRDDGAMRHYREGDPLGGHDPYSSSKACAELAVDAFARSFFDAGEMPRVASARAGNVIGGGDWGRDRLIPDAVQAFSRDVPLAIRNPAAVRPWQHVLDAAYGYMILARHLIERGRSAVGAWNFGPSRAGEVSVQQVADRLATLWGRTAARWQHVVSSHPHESGYLSLDSSKAQTQLGWRPAVGLDEALRSTVEWYRGFYQGEDMRALSLAQIKTFCDSAGAARAILDGAEIRAPSIAGDSHP